MTPQEEIGPLGDVPVDIEVELDRRIMTTREVLQLEEGMVIGTSRSAGENIDLYIGGVLCGSGEIVVIENELGVRITDFRDDL
ncbi:MAG TPA: FliM/FliN family flagellar motor switch protein [Candidatus Acidoferrales bacterium]|nr:FliM/FliN family flagellar motor switch protein [Candidatus Acidoferrales bacterium]